MIEKFELTKIQKLTISAFFIALVIIFSKLLSIGNIPGVPFLRVSLGPTLLIFASLLLGPIYGGAIGFLSDLIGYFTLDRTGYAYNPLFSITYILYGILPAILVYILKYNKKFKLPIIQVIIFSILDIFILYFILTTSEFKLYGKTYNVDLIMKTVVICVTFLFTILYFLIYFFLYKKFKTNKENIVLLNNISIINFIVLFIVQLVIGILIKLFTYDVDVLVLLATQIIATIVEIFISNYIVILLYNASLKIFKTTSNIKVKKSQQIKQEKIDKLKSIIKEELNYYKINK